MAGQQLARRGGLAARGTPGADVDIRDTTTHGEWLTNSKKVIAALVFLGRLLDEMTGNLTAANASRAQIRDVGAWAANVASRRQWMLDELVKIDARLVPLIAAIEAAGGVEEVADAGYHADY